MMSPLRVIFGSALVAFIAVFAVMAWMDRAAPVSITIEPLPPEPIRVAVSGAVATPGVVTVPAGSRLSDIANAAGGLTADADTSALNLAGRVGDGEHVVIPRIASANATGVPVLGANTSENAAPLDLNLASVDELEMLPGIGEVLAGRIVAYRDEHGPFASVNDLALVEGISERLLEDLLPLVTVSDGT
jgi:competence protein ComEA